MGVFEMVNKNSVPIDISTLESVEDPYGEELRSRMGLERVEGILDFMREVER